MQFPRLKNDLILRAARGQEVDRQPVWIMRQAGRYLPEFRHIRESHSFFDLCQTPELACAVTLQPIDKYDGLLDAAIIFSDILVVLQAIGLTVEMKPGVGPSLPNPVKNETDLASLTVEGAADRLSYVYDAINLTRNRLEGRVPLIGFTGAPWTLMTYAIEGGPSKTMAASKKWLYARPGASRQFLDLLADVNIEYLVRQVKAGAQMLQIFESHAGYLTPDLFKEFCFPVLRRIAQSVKKRLQEENLDVVPMVIFAKDGHFALDLLSSITEYDVIGLDWTVEPQNGRSIVGVDKSLQGNLDPCHLYADEDDIERGVQRMAEKFRPSKRWIVNLGHGIYPDVDPDKVRTFLQAVHKYARM